MPKCIKHIASIISLFKKYKNPKTISLENSKFDNFQPQMKRKLRLYIILPLQLELKFSKAVFVTLKKLRINFFGEGDVLNYNYIINKLIK